MKGRKDKAESHLQGRDALCHSMPKNYSLIQCTEAIREKMKLLHSCVELMFIALAVELIILECWHLHSQEKLPDVFGKIIISLTLLSANLYVNVFPGLSLVSQRLNGWWSESPQVNL